MRNIIHKSKGWSFALAMVLLLVAVPFVAAFSTTLAYADAKPANNTATWEYIPDTTCSDTNVPTTIHAKLVYTDDFGQTFDFTCYTIVGQQNSQMVLNGPKNCNIYTSIDVGDINPNPSNTYKNALSATLIPTANKNGCIAPGIGQTIKLNNTYAEVPVNGPPQGSADWTRVNPASLKANFTINGYTAKDEIFSQDSIVGPTLILKGTSQASAQCGQDEIDVGDSDLDYLNKNTKTATVIIQQYMHDIGPSFTCTPTQATITLVRSYADAGGKATTPANQDPCFVDGGLTIRWIVCPLLNNTLIPLVESINNLIGSLLATPTAEIFSPSFEVAFDAFRNIGIGLLVISGLVMVVSEASGLEIFAAYTVRKALPRIVIATIFIALAWPLLQFTVTLFNDLGSWIGQIILSIANVRGNGDTAIFNLITGALITALLGTVYSVVTLAFLSWGGFGLLLVSAALLLMTALLVLAIRQIIILLCILLAPLAIASFVLPGTERLGRFWRDTLITTLIVYPIIMGVTAAGAAMAYLTLSIPGAHPILGVVAIIEWLAPYPLYIFIFQMAGGIWAQVVSRIHGLNQQSFEGRLRQMRQHDREHNWGQFRAGNSTHMALSSFGLRDGLNRLGSNVGAFGSTNDKMGWILNRNGARDAAMTRHLKMAQQDWAREAGTIATQNHDDMLWAQHLGITEQESEHALRDMWRIRDAAGNDLGADENRVQRAMAAAHAQGGFGRVQQQYATEQLAVTGTGYQNLNQMVDAIARTAGNNVQRIEDVAGAMNFSTKQAGRHDLAPGAANLINLVRQRVGLPQTGAVGAPAYTMEQAAVDAWNSGSLYQHANDKDLDMRNNIENFIGTFDANGNVTRRGMLMDNRVGATPEEQEQLRAQREQAAIFMNELRAMLPNTTGSVRSQIERVVNNVQIQERLHALTTPGNHDYLGDTADPIFDRQNAPLIEHQGTVQPITGQINVRQVAVPQGTRRETAAERIGRVSRTYDRLDPNRL